MHSRFENARDSIVAPVAFALAIGAASVGLLAAPVSAGADPPPVPTVVSQGPETTPVPTVVAQLAQSVSGTKTRRGSSRHGSHRAPARRSAAATTKAALTGPVGVVGTLEAAPPRSYIAASRCATCAATLSRAGGAAPSRGSIVSPTALGHPPLGHPARPRAAHSSPRGTQTSTASKSASATATSSRATPVAATASSASQALLFAVWAIALAALAVIVVEFSRALGWRAPWARPGRPPLGPRLIVLDRVRHWRHMQAYRRRRWRDMHAYRVHRWRQMLAVRSRYPRARSFHAGSRLSLRMRRLLGRAWG
jgi:hypothetical protein